MQAFPGDRLFYLIDHAILLRQVKDMEQSLDSDKNSLLSSAIASKKAAFLDSAMACLEHDLSPLEVC